MNAEDARKLARRFIELPLEKRRIFLQGLRREGVDFAQFPIPAQVPVAERGGLSYAQQRMWLLWQLEPASAAYNLPSAVRLQGKLQVAALEQAFASLVQRHETLRSVFVQQADEQLALLPAPQWPQVEHLDLSAMPEQAREQRLRALAQAQSLQPFDLAGGPLLRVLLLRLAADQHVLLMTLHHIVSDGWSMNVLIEEFSQLYAAHLANQAPTLAALPIQYSDYALWQRCWLEAGEQERQLEYWRAKLGEEHPPLELPLDHSRPALPSYRGARQRFSVDPALAQALGAWARSEGVTLFMLLLSAFNILLYRYTGQGDLRIGVPIANRNRSEVEGLIGCFVNTQVLRNQLDAQMTVRQLLAAVKETVLGAQSHQDLPFEQLVDAFDLERSLSHTPLFQVMYNHQPQVADVTTLKLAGGLQMSQVDWQSRTTQFDLSLDTYEQGGQLQAALTYASDLFDAPTIERMGRHWLNLLRAMLAAPELPLEQLAMLDAPELQRIVVDWNDTGVDYPLQQPLQRLIEAQVERSPDATALLFAGQTLTYAELNARANQLAHCLIEAGIGADSLVGIAVERSVEMVVGLLAILKAGAAYVPFDPDYPAERLAYMIEDSGVRLVLTQAVLTERLPLQAVQVLVLDQAGAWLGGYSTANPQLLIDPQQLAYVIYTSGSTGRPKGAGNSHAALVNRLCWMQQAYGLDASDTVLQKTPFSFDVSVWEFFWPLLAGARLAVAAPGEHREPARLIASIERMQVTTLHFVPSMLQAFIHEPGVECCHSLKRIVCSGEALPVDAQQQVFAKLPQAALYNLYGPTEAAIDVTHWTCVDEGRDSVPIGLPIANLRTLVLDASLAPVPPGVSGELYLGGQGLARGYHRRPGLTAERFVVDPFGTGERLYRTGDRVRQRDSGVIEYLGRFDHQVKIRGLRIELGEIEARLAQHALVREAVVLAHNGKQLVSYLVLEQAPADWQQQLKDWLLLALPEFMLPSQLLALQHLPLTPNGKLDRKALPAPDAQAQVAYAAPQSALQQQLGAIWQAVLGVEQVGLDDNFFALGGDSIIAIQVVSRARQAGLQLSPRDLFQYQTLRSLEPWVGQQAQVEAEQGRVSGEVRLTPVQQGFFAQAMAGRSHWNQSLLLTPRQALLPALLNSALQQLLAQHDALRLRFEQSADGWHQYHVQEPADDLLWLRQATDAQALAELCEAAQRSLDLANGPLLRAMLVEMADGGQRLLVVIHHLVVDGVSWRILLEDLQHFYTCLQAGQTAAQLAKTSAYQAWAEQLHDYAERAAQQLPYWQAQLEQALDLPCDNPQGGLSNRDAGKVEFTLDAANTRRLLQDAPAAYRTQVNDLLLTALARAVCDWSGEDSMLVELEGHGREELFAGIDLTRTVGWFTSLFPLRLQPAAQLSASIKGIKEQLRAVPDRGLGYGVLRYLAPAQVHARLKDSPGRARITFNYLGRFDSQFDERSMFVPAQESPGASQAADAPLANWLSVEGQVYGGQLNLSLTFSQAMFDTSTIQALADAYGAQLLQLVEHCCSQGSVQPTPADFPLAGLDQRQLDELAPLPGLVDDLYPLSPMQQGMLFHGLYAEQGSAYINQLRVDVDDLEPARLHQAWEATLQAHDILRSGFIWQGELAQPLQQPLQFVRKQVALGLLEHDWRDRPDLAQLLDAQALAQREQGFDLQAAPLLNLVLVRVAERRHHLIYTHHHILMDGWSNARVLAEVLQRYHGLVPARPASRYRDYIERLQQLDSEAARQFWMQQLQALDGPLYLAQYVPGAHRDSALRGDYHQTIGVEQSARLSHFARQQQVTLNTLVQGAWLLLLQHYSGRGSVVVGATVAGRSMALPGLEQQVGLFINTLPVIASPRPEQTVAQWLQTVQALNLELREHEHTPLFEIQRWAGQQEALFDHILVFENYPLAQALEQAQGPRFGTLHNHEQTHYPLSVAVNLGEQLSLDYNYACQAFSDEALHALAGHFQHLLVALAESAERALGEVPMLAARQRGEVLQLAGAEAAVPAHEGFIHQMIEAQALATPQAPALEFAGEHLSYGQLNTQANHLALRLREAGVGPDVVVALAVERSLEMLVGLLAILKAGGVYLPLDLNYPQARIDFMLADSDARLLLSRPGVALQVPAQVKVLMLDDARAPMPPIADLGVALDAQHLAYMIYTSGSTGTPKGVQVRHQALTNHMRWMQRTLPLHASDRVLQKTALSFDASVWECWLPLMCGAQLVIAEPQLASDMSRLWAQVQALQISVVQAAPSLLQALLGNATAQNMSGLRYLMVGGEALSGALVNQVRQQWSGPIVNLYGPTEATIEVTCQIIDNAAQPLMAAIGRPIDNVRVQVLGNHLQCLPAGVVGELCIAGRSLARGYHRRPGLTAERFVPDPHAEEPGARLYRTGDLGHYGAAGQLCYSGRSDQQVKIRGFRIETGEIQAQLLRQPSVADALVLALPGSGGPQLVAYVVPAGAASLAPDVLRQALAQSLPEYMQPSHWHVLERLPLTANGKLDRKALPANDAPSAHGYRAPHSQLQVQLADIWQALLQVPQVGLDDDFFELGGHSLHLVMLQSRLRSQLGLDVTLKEFHRLRRLEALANHLQQSLGEDDQALELDLIFGALDELEEHNA